LQASIVPAFLQGQRRELFKGAQHFSYFHASTALFSAAKVQIFQQTTKFTASYFQLIVITQPT
jgi:hypothetical protein